MQLPRVAIDEKPLGQLETGLQITPATLGDPMDRGPDDMN
jgi:hypothetical protein